MGNVDNSLEPGDARTGFLVVDGDERQDLRATLANTGTSFELSLSIRDSARDDMVRQWFSFGSRRHLQTPRVLGFADDRGTAVLVGCRARQYRSNGAVDVGRGVVVPNYVVLGPFRTGYETVNGVRSDWTHLADWAGTKAVDFEPARVEDGRVQAVNYHLAVGDPVCLHRRMNLAVEGTWRTNGSSRRTTVLHDAAAIQTRVKRARAWEDHLDLHEAVRELVLLSCWKEIGLTHLSVLRDSDPDRSLAGTSHGEIWRQALSHRLAKGSGQDEQPWFLFSFEEIGPAGFARWLEIRSHFSRTFEELVALRDHPPRNWSSAVVSTGIALENLGYCLAVEQGMSRSDWRSFDTYTRLILDSLELVPLPDAAEWQARANACYMGAKHGNRSVPDSAVVVETFFDNLLVMRLWLAGRLGVTGAVLTRNVQADPHMNHVR